MAVVGTAKAPAWVVADDEPEAEEAPEADDDELLADEEPEAPPSMRSMWATTGVEVSSSQPSALARRFTFARGMPVELATGPTAVGTGSEGAGFGAKKCW